MVEEVGVKREQSTLYFMKILSGVILLTSLSLCVAAAPAAGLGAKKPYRSVKHASHQKDHRLVRVVKTSIRYRPVASGVGRSKVAHPRVGGAVTGSGTGGGIGVGTGAGVVNGAGRSDEFRRQKGHLDWPLSGTVSMAFGPHEYIKGIIHDNQSATIDCAEGSVVRAVYAGEVTAVMDIQGVWCVILKHGSYYTAYSNLATTTVAQGDQVQAGESLGQVGNIGQLEFMLADEGGRFYDPEVWLKR